MNEYNKITALYSRLSVGDEDRDSGESNSIQNHFFAYQLHDPQTDSIAKGKSATPF